MLQAFDESFQHNAFQLYINTDYVDCGYVWGGYVGGDGGGTGGRLKFWDGVQWTAKPLRTWNGSTWID